MNLIVAVSVAGEGWTLQRQMLLRRGVLVWAESQNVTFVPSDEVSITSVMRPLLITCIVAVLRGNDQGP